MLEGTAARLAAERGAVSEIAEWIARANLEYVMHEQTSLADRVPGQELVAE